MPLLSKKYYRLAPCPYYDVESMERWLEAEAMDGYFLIENGFLFGVGTFEKKAMSCKISSGTKRSVRLVSGESVSQCRG